MLVIREEKAEPWWHRVWTKRRTPYFTNLPSLRPFSQYLLSFWQPLCTSTWHKATYFYLVLSKISRPAWENNQIGVNLSGRGSIFLFTPCSGDQQNDLETSSSEEYTKMLRRRMISEVLHQSSNKPTVFDLTKNTFRVLMQSWCIG